MVVIATVVMALPSFRLIAQSARPNKVLYISNRANLAEPYFNIYTMNPDGSEQTRLTSTALKEYDPVYSPDGKRIAFCIGETGMEPKGEVWLMNADGSDRKQLAQSEPGAIAMAPSWSPDGKRIAYNTFAGLMTPTPQVTIHLMDSDGKNNKVLCEGMMAAWSPDGTKILYTQIEKDEPSLHIMNADGTDSKRFAGGIGMMAAWSPDGQRVVYVWGANAGEQGDIYIANADGSGAKPIIKTPEMEFGPQWSPDGKRVFFSRIARAPQNLQTPPKTAIFSINVDGSDLKQHTDYEALDYLGPAGFFVIMSYK